MTIFNNNVKNVLIISKNLRTNSNSYILTNAFLSGTMNAGEIDGIKC